MQAPVKIKRKHKDTHKHIMTHMNAYTDKNENDILQEHIEILTEGCSDGDSTVVSSQ